MTDKKKQDKQNKVSFPSVQRRTEKTTHCDYCDSCNIEMVGEASSVLEESKFKEFKERENKEKKKGINNLHIVFLCKNCGAEFINSYPVLLNLGPLFGQEELKKTRSFKNVKQSSNDRPTAKA